MILKIYALIFAFLVQLPAATEAWLSPQATVNGQKRLTAKHSGSTIVVSSTASPLEVEQGAALEREAMNDIMYQPDEEYKKSTLMYKFQTEVAGLDGDSASYDDLWEWSNKNDGDQFWEKLMNFLDIRYTGSLEPTKEGAVMPDVTYFPNVQLNFAENLLKHGEPDSPLANAEALVTVSEALGDTCRADGCVDPDDAERLSFAELRDDASRVIRALKKLGVTMDDACGAYMPNIGATVTAMLGTTGRGAVWTSCSPDFGIQAVSDRFGQVKPKVLFTVNGIVSKGEVIPMVEKVESLIEQLPSLEKVVVVDMIGELAPEWSSKKAKSLIVDWTEFLAQGSNDDGTAPEPEYTPVPFAHPQFVLYSSGTTGMPKSIAHGAGNTLLQHAKELVLHSDLRPKDRMLFFTTCGWMMWNWATSALFAGATVVAFDGFPAYPKLSSPWDLVAQEKITHMGTTPRYLQACRARVRPGRDYDMSNLRVMFSTGSPLLPEDFDYVYTHVKQNELMLASISGGTDICSCFALGNPLLPVRKGELQAFGLGLDACAFDRYETKAPVVGEKAELVCRSPFVAAPVCFFGDDEKKSKYRGAYFEDEAEFPGMWFHGDFVEVTGSSGGSGGVIIHGRSDTTLKPGGIRIGTAEIYRFAEQVAVLEDSLVIGDQIKEGRRKGDVRVVLFVQLEEGTALSKEIEEEIRSTIRAGASDAHVPAIIKEVKAIPYTKSGKKVEVAVRDLFAGVEPKNVGALIDPSAFDEYRKMAEEGL